MTQLSFPDPEQNPISVKFAEFHRENPHVYVELVKLARRGRKAGRMRMGIQQLLEVLRWNYSLTTQGDDFKLNNSFAAHYARMIMERESDLDGAFELRRSHADEARDL